MGPESYSVVSYGKDGRLDWSVALGATTSFNADIWFSDGGFAAYPEGIQQ